MKTIPAGLLETVVERLKTEFQPEQIFLFGSQAWDTPTEDSDTLSFSLDQPENLPIGKKHLPMKAAREMPRLFEQFLRLSVLDTGILPSELELPDHA